jgi:sec-independent protein translocase protein TatB
LTGYGELSVFDLSITKLLLLALIALVVFGPNELPRIAHQAGRALRDLRRIAEGAKADLKEGLGPEFQDFDFEDLNPKRFVTKHLFDDTADTADTASTASAMTAMTSAADAQAAAHIPNGKAIPTDTVSTAAPVTEEVADYRPPFDLEAT